MITSNIYERVMQIDAVGVNGRGTAFSVEIDGHPYLVTAAHVVPATDNVEMHLTTVRGAVDIRLRRAWGPNDDLADTAVFALPSPITPTLPAEASSKGMVFGQDMFFLGYPLGLSFEVSPTQTLAFVKKAPLSAQARVADGIHHMYLDGHNNRGFSGGPVVFRPSEESRHPFQIAGIVSAFRVEPEYVQKADAPVGDLHVPANAGIVVASEIGYAVATAKAHLME